MTDRIVPRLLIVDDEADMLNMLKRSITEDVSCHIDTAVDAAGAQALLERSPYDVVLLDVRMPGMNGMEFLERIRPQYPDVTVVMMTGHGTIDLAVKAIKKGAYDFLTKPFDHDRLIHVLANALERSRLVRENRELMREISERTHFHKMVATSAKMNKIFEVIKLYGDTDATVLITGESGTGKDLAARALHAESDRNKKPFIAINCPNLPENILESELFGYKKGAFTHATRDKRGLFVEAEGGTIYLDEIGDIPPTLQTKLLRVLQEKEIRPLGDTRNMTVDVRIVASTNQDLAQKISEKTFREDLFYRLNVLSLVMPPLRERPEDVPILAEHFLRYYAKEFRKDVHSISRKALDRLIPRPWRGNVRELENVMRRAIILAAGPEIDVSDIEWDDPGEITRPITDDVKQLGYKDAKARVLEQFHNEYIGDLLTRNAGNITHSARESGMERQALQQVMKRYGIKAKDFQPESN